MFCTKKIQWYKVREKESEKERDKEISRTAGDEL